MMLNFDGCKGEKEASQIFVKSNGRNTLSAGSV